MISISRDINLNVWMDSEMPQIFYIMAILYSIINSVRTTSCAMGSICIALSPVQLARHPLLFNFQRGLRLICVMLAYMPLSRLPSHVNLPP